MNAYDAEVRRGIHTGEAYGRYNLARANYNAAGYRQERADALLGRAQLALQRAEDLNRDIAIGVLSADSHSAQLIHGTAVQVAGGAAASAASSTAAAAHTTVCAPMR